MLLESRTFHRRCFVHTSRMLDCLTTGLASSVIWHLGFMSMRDKASGFYHHMTMCLLCEGGVTSLLDLVYSVLTEYNVNSLAHKNRVIVSCVATKANLTSLHESGV